MTVCMHLNTTVLGKARGLICSDCGELVFTFEDRECRHCANFQNRYPDPHCTKTQRSVFHTMHALFELKTGTCFDEKT